MSRRPPGLRVLRRAGQALALSALALSALACRPEPTVEPDGLDPGAGIEDVAIAPVPAEPSNREAGEQLELTIPVYGGGEIELASLRGRPVLLELSASWEAGFAEAHALYAQLLADNPQLTVVVVAADPEDAGLEGLAQQAAASERMILSWDPAGALSARLRVALFPTMFVLDGEGRIVTIENGFDERISATLSDGVATASAP